MKYITLTANTEHILTDCDADQTCEPASLTKLMTLNLILDDVKDKKISLDDKISIPTDVKDIPDMASLNMNGHGFRYSENRTPALYPIHELIMASAGFSDGFATIALAQHACKAEFNAQSTNAMTSFIARMNKTAKEFGLVSTCYKNVTGMPCKGQVSTAFDVARLLKKMYEKHPQALRTYLGQSSYYLPSIDRHFQNTSPLISDNNIEVWGKTGYTHKAGYCFAGFVQAQSHDVIAVVMGATSPEKRDSQFKSITNQCITHGKRALT